MRAGLVLVVLTACASAVQMAPPGEHVYPGSSVLRVVEGSEVDPYCGGDVPGCCPTAFVTYATTDEPEAVTVFFEERGFLRLGEGGRFAPDRYRWVGERAGDRETWRRVDIASGNVAGYDDSPSVYTVDTPDCDAEPRNEHAPAPTPAPTRP